MNTRIGRIKKQSKTLPTNFSGDKTTESLIISYFHIHINLPVPFPSISNWYCGCFVARETNIYVYLLSIKNKKTH